MSRAIDVVAVFGSALISGEGSSNPKLAEQITREVTLLFKSCSKLFNPVRISKYQVSIRNTHDAVRHLHDAEIVCRENKGCFFEFVDLLHQP